MLNDSWLPEVFNDFFPTSNYNRTKGTAPAINVLENANSYKVELAAPGLGKDDFQVSLNQDGDLSIKLLKKEEHEEETHYLRREFSYSEFEQTLVLPDDVDKDNIQARVADGVLTVTLPKIGKEEHKVSRTIQVG